MSLTRIKETFIRLPRHTQLIAIGSLILAVATFLPWYADLDSYRIGDQFLGITGPASFIGLAILVLAGLSLWLSVVRLLQRRITRLPVRESILHLFVGGEALFLLFIVNSIYFHQKFGVNITIKESRFGMTLAIIGAGLLFIGAYMHYNSEGKEVDEVGRIEPLINIENRQQGRLSAQERTATPIIRPPVQRAAANSEQSNKLKGFGHDVMTPEKSSEKKDTSGEGSYMIRMDL